MTDKETLIDILNCIIDFDDSSDLKTKGRYFEVIQRDLRKLFPDKEVINKLNINKN